MVALVFTGNEDRKAKNEMIKQKCIKRKKVTVNKGVFGENDYVSHIEEFDDFVNRVTKKANKINGKIINIQYTKRDKAKHSDVAIIVYKTKNN